MAYTTIDKPTDYFNTVTWSGDDTSPRNITGVGFQPDLVWGKVKSRIGNHWLIDSNRGTTGSLYRVLNADDTATEQTTNSGGTTSYGVVTTIGTDGFTVADGSLGDLNVNNTGDTYVSWNWLAGGSASSNTDGSITSTVSANTTAGFSIVSWTGSNANATIGHGLSSAPEFITIKNRNDASSWLTYLTTIGAGNFLRLNETNASASGSTPFNNTASTSSVFSVGANNDTNGSSDSMIAYCFSSVRGYSKIGRYTGNGSSDGTFVYTGFKPAWVMIKRTDTTNNWLMYDNKRDPDNLVGGILFPNLSNAEDVQTTNNILDFTSNGFKLRSSSAATNASGGSYIYMCFSENPFVTSTGIPTCAR